MQVISIILVMKGYKMDYKICAYYTIDTPYEEEAKKLEASIQKLGLDYTIDGYPNRSRWEFNCGIKPEFLKHCLDTYDKTIVYVDVDALIYRPLDLAENFQHDLAVHYRAGLEVLSGTLIFGNTDGAKNIVNDWIIAQRANPKKWDQHVLQGVITNSKYDIVSLPANYIKIFDMMPYAEEPIYIEHFQASRKYKRKLFVDGGIKVEIPANLNVKIRVNSDGSFWIPRKNIEAEKYFDAAYIRVPNELRWWPCSMDKEFHDKYYNKYKNKTCCIVGKGPSLDNLTADTFNDDCIIIGINEAFNTVEDMGLSNTFGTQQDTWMGSCCEPKNKGILFVSPRAAKLYVDCVNVEVINPVTFGIGFTPPSYAFAIELGKYLGCTNFKLYCLLVIISE